MLTSEQLFGTEKLQAMQDAIDRRLLLIKAEILTPEGDYHPDWFSPETIAKDKERRGRNE